MIEPGNDNAKNVLPVHVGPIRTKHLAREVRENLFSIQSSTALPMYDIFLIRNEFFDHRITYEVEVYSQEMNEATHIFYQCHWFHHLLFVLSKKHI